MAQSKLVRDKIPDIIRASGAEPLIRTADSAEYSRLLREKLQEEVAEVIAAEDPPSTLEELADVMEVVLAYAAHLGAEPEQLNAVRQAKEAERGGFCTRIVWSGDCR
jgi:predicted house-cleaning noncanonical NTP pyrophosphatase (MazG superfamily)